MEERLNSILTRIMEGTLLPAGYFADLDCDAALDSRDRDSDFDARWVRLFKQIESRWPTATIDDNLRELAEDIREKSFLAVSQATSLHEIASYVSDDFDLLVRGELLGLDDPLFEQLWRVYDDGKFPGPPLSA